VPANPGKVNQDTLIAVRDVGGHATYHLFGICDGHGLFGKEASSLVR
jgi:serine/threonine protein phosphatase PrpC